MAEKATKKPNKFANFFRGIGRFFRDTRGELKKVVWPSRKQVWNNFVVVVVFVVIFAAIIFVLDLAFSHLLELVLNLSIS